LIEQLYFPTVDVMDRPSKALAQARRRAEEIRKLALAHLLTPQAGYRPRAMVIELGELAEDHPELDKEPAFLQARILSTLARGGRARQAQKPLFRLFRAGIEAGQPETYQQFEQVLKYACPDPDQLEGLFFHRSFQDMDHDEIWSAVGDGIAKLQALGFQAFLNSGTLLGVVRDGKLIPHDDDVDLALVFEAESQEEAAETWHKITVQLADQGLLSPKPPRNPAMRKLTTEGPCNIDLFPAWVQAGQLYVYPYCCGDLAADHVLPTEVCPITGLPIPRNAPDVLAQNYGDGWAVPDPSYAFPWAQANRRFKAFRDRLDQLTER
ncbi:MAG: LicD family protein, partial [Pseudomonadota bacterium]|nr:LicD family protein [Pseudomonadota bacterium]